MVSGVVYVVRCFMLCVCDTMVCDVALNVRGLTSAYEIRWSAVICIQTGLAGALLLPCRETHCSTSLQSTPCMQYLVHLYVPCMPVHRVHVRVPSIMKSCTTGSTTGNLKHYSRWYMLGRINVERVYFFGEFALLQIWRLAQW